MKGNKGFKFINLIIIFVCISAFLSMIPTTISVIGRGAGVLTSYMHKNQFGIEEEFYKSRAFDNNLMSYLTSITSGSVVGVDKDSSKEDKNNIEETRKYSRKELKGTSNLNYFIINKDTNEIYTNTDSKTAKEFQNKYKVECDVKILSKDHNVSYSKTFNNNEYKDSNVNNELGSVMQLRNGDIYMSIPENFEHASGIHDKICEAKSDFNRDIVSVQIILATLGSSLILGIISTFLYKRSKAELFDKDSFWLKLSKLVPLELYILGLIWAVVFLMQSVDYYYDMLSSFIFSFLGIGFICTVLYIFNKQINSYDNKLDFFKTTFVYRVFNFSKKILVNTSKLTISMPLSKRIVGLTIVCIVVNLFLMIIAIDSYNPFIAIISSALTIGGLSYYVLKKLWYLSYIMDGTQRIKNGDIHHKLKLIGEDNFTTLADNINNIRDGLDKAIDNQLKSERMKSELITNVSHDLKTPLTSIINYVELIKKEENISPEYLKDYVNVLDSKSRRLKILIEDLFEASKASSGNIELNMEKIDLIQLLRQSIGEMEEKLSEANLDLKISIPEDKAYVRADGRRLYRVLENLLINISKYSLPNTRVYIDIIEEDSKVKLTMKNISSYELNFDPEEIMERFKRADDSRNTEGSGLGLAIARDLVNLQGGTFSIDIDGDLFKSIVEFDIIR
ncbi:sensor histidine kinase [Terrisporobacter mayombei]|uniref:histidine kinase n=1 Tax=Terrisporobacter mayombei TaxID=1541 RepID=A0ABY9Q3Z6_9FIRM|nr:sensor histidine kinase [Terrisporobacter mayombei]MCC3870166.1 sensor histidine kinase [Terrisporobacter mayombei]WMT82622.1 Adaptive-response sensory-kinase SasA [Terrisporobacter mayombei]